VSIVSSPAAQNGLPQQTSPALLTATQVLTPTPTARLIPSLTSTATRLAVTATVTLTPTVTATSTPLACWKSPGRLVKSSLNTEFLRLPLDFRIHLPPCYDVERSRHYPVLYLIHGQSFNDDQWDRLGADETADSLAAAGELPPFIIVMPRDRTGDQPPEDGFARAVAEVLLPYVDKNFRTIADRQHRAVGGLSRGAGWSVHLGLVYWDLFGALGAHSPAIFHEDARLMRVYLDEIPAGSHPRIFIDVGEKDRPEIYDAAIWFEQVLNEKDVPHEWYLFPGYHEEAYWHAHVEKYLRWYAKEW
jgi:enterochelin esterase-like enzyme